MTKTQEGQTQTTKALDEAAKAFQEGKKALEELAGKITAAKTDIQTAQVKTATTATVAETTQQKDTNAQAAQSQKESREKRDRALDAKIGEAQAALTTAPEKDKPAARVAIAQLEDEQDPQQAE